MTSRRTPAAIAAILILAGALGACADMTPREKNTAIGAGVGAAAGAVLTNGSKTDNVAAGSPGGLLRL